MVYELGLRIACAIAFSYAYVYDPYTCEDKTYIDSVVNHRNDNFVLFLCAAKVMFIWFHLSLYWVLQLKSHRYEI